MTKDSVSFGQTPPSETAACSTFDAARDHRFDFNRVCKEVNESPLLQSLLYDLDLLPEQTMCDPLRWRYTVTVAAYMTWTSRTSNTQPSNLDGAAK